MCHSFFIPSLSLSQVHSSSSSSSLRVKDTTNDAIVWIKDHDVTECAFHGHISLFIINSPLARLNIDLWMYESTLMFLIEKAKIWTSPVHRDERSSDVICWRQTLIKYSLGENSNAKKVLALFFLWRSINQDDLCCLVRFDNRHVDRHVFLSAISNLLDQIEARTAFSAMLPKVLNWNYSSFCRKGNPKETQRDNSCARDMARIDRSMPVRFVSRQTSAACVCVCVYRQTVDPQR